MLSSKNLFSLLPLLSWFKLLSGKECIIVGPDQCRTLCRHTVGINQCRYQLSQMKCEASDDEEKIVSEVILLNYTQVDSFENDTVKADYKKFAKMVLTRLRAPYCTSQCSTRVVSDENLSIIFSRTMRRKSLNFQQLRFNSASVKNLSLNGRLVNCITYLPKLKLIIHSENNPSRVIVSDIYKYTQWIILDKITHMYITTLTADRVTNKLYFTTYYSIYQANFNGRLTMILKFKKRIRGLTVDPFANQLFFCTVSKVYAVSNDSRKITPISDARKCRGILFNEKDRSLYLLDVTMVLKIGKMDSSSSSSKVVAFKQCGDVLDVHQNQLYIQYKYDSLESRRRVAFAIVDLSTGKYKTFIIPMDQKKFFPFTVVYNE